MKILVTGGHLTPALAVIDELKKKNDNLTVLFVGRKFPLEGDRATSAEYQTITQRGIPFLSLKTGRLQRRFTRYTLTSLLKIPVGFFQALWWLGKFRPDVVLSFGGYVALPVVIAGWLWRVPIVTHEQTAKPGLANKIIAKFAKKICLSWPDTAHIFPAAKIVLTGNPIRKEIFKISKNPQLNNIVSDFRLPVIYVTGGSLGSHTINEVISQCLTDLLERYIVIHQCGNSQKYKDFEKTKVQIEELKGDLKKRYVLTKYVGPEDIGWVLNKADLIIGRAGANTVTELAALGKPAILIPLPWAGAGEQMENAKILQNKGAAIILPQNELSEKTLVETTENMMSKIDEYKKAAMKAKDLIYPDASQKIAAMVEEIYESSCRKPSRLLGMKVND